MSGGVPPVVIDFLAKGIPTLGKAFDTVEQRIAAMEKKATAVTASETRIRVRSTKSETSEREKAYAKLVKQIEKDEEKAKKATERESKLAANAAISETKRVTKETERAEAEKMRIRRRSSEMAGRYAAQQAAQEIREAERAATAQERAAIRSQSAWGRIGRRAGGTITGTMGRLAGGAFGAASMALGIGGGAVAVDAVRREASAERSAALLVNQVTIGGKPPEGASVANILGQASQVSKETGMSKEQLIEGTREYAKTARGGDFGGAMANMGFFAKMSQVTGKDMGEIAGAAGMLQSQNGSLAADPKKMQQMILDVYAQTKSGSLGMGEIISQMGRMGSVRGAFQGDETTNQRKLMALGQLVAPAAGAESGVMIADLALEATRGKHLEKAKAAGVKFDARNRIESPEQMIGAILKSTNGDIGKIGDILGQRGGTLLRELSSGYTAARDKGGKGAAGIAAGDAYLKETIGSVTGSTMSSGDLNAQFEQMMSTPAQRFETAMNKVIDTLEDKAEPYLQEFADKLPEITPYIESFIDEMGKLVSWFSSDPLAGIGEVVKTAIEIDLAKAAIGEMVKMTLARLMTGMGGPGGVPERATELAVDGALGGAAPKAAGVMGTIKKWAPRALLAYAAVEGYRDILEASSAAENYGQNVSLNKSTTATNAALSLSAKARSGTVTAADIKAAEAQAAGLQGQLKGEQDYAKTGGGFWQIGGSHGSANEARRAAGAGEAKNTAMALDMLTEAIKKAKANVDGLGAAAHEATNGVKGNPARSAPINDRNHSGT